MPLRNAQWNFYLPAEDSDRKEETNIPGEGFHSLGAMTK